MSKEPTLKACTIQTKLGEMLAISNDTSLCLLKFSDAKDLDKEVRRLQGDSHGKLVIGQSPPLKSIQAELKLYFEGRLTTFNTPISTHGTAFQKLVWKSLRDIPFGETRSYLEEAKAIGKETAVRAVANANGRNPLAIIIPCHRVINANGHLGGYAGGPARKQWLIDHESTLVKRLTDSTEQP